MIDSNWKDIDGKRYDPAGPCHGPMAKSKLGISRAWTKEISGQYLPDTTSLD